MGFKTTLLRCMMGLTSWNSGRTKLDGQDLNAYSAWEIWKRLAYVPQARSVTFSYSAFETVLFGRSAHLEVIRQPRQKDLNIDR